jgi:hypothetical protein
LGRYLALYLTLANPASLSPGSKIYAQTTLRILDQKQVKSQYGKGKICFNLKCNCSRKMLATQNDS